MNLRISVCCLLFFFISYAIGQESRRHPSSQRRQPSSTASSYDDYYYDYEAQPEAKPHDKPKDVGGGRGGPHPPKEPAAPHEDYDEPSPKPSSSTTSKPSFSSPSSRSKSNFVPQVQPAEDLKKNKSVSPATLFLAPRANRKPRPSVSFPNKPRPTLPSFIKSPPALGNFTTTTSRPRIVITEEPRHTRQQKESKIVSTTTAKPRLGSRGRSRDRTTESPVRNDDQPRRRFGHTSSSKNSPRPRFRPGSDS